MLMNSLRQIAAKASEKPLTLFSYFRTCVACLPSYLFTLIPPLLWCCNYENKQNREQSLVFNSLSRNASKCTMPSDSQFPTITNASLLNRNHSIWLDAWEMSTT